MKSQINIMRQLQELVLTRDEHHQTGDGSHLLSPIELLGFNPSHQFGTLLGVGTIHGIDEHIGLLVRGDITTNGLAEDLGVAIDIEQVVLQLEGQTNLLTKLIQQVGILL